MCAECMARHTGAQVQAKVYSKEGRIAGEERAELRGNKRAGDTEKSAPCGLLDSTSQPAMTGYGFPDTSAEFPHLFLKLA